MMTGVDSTNSIESLYDYIGSVLNQLNGLISTVEVKEKPKAVPKKKHFHVF
jgi:hypothetical protein